MTKVDDKGFYKMLISITIPIALQNLMSFMINMVDTVMLGALGEIQLSAGNLANQLFFIFNIITFGLSGGGAVLSSQFWGKKDILSIRQVISIVVRISIIISIIFSFTVIFFPKNVMNIYTNDIEIALEGVKYLKIIGFSYLFFGITNTFLCSIRSLEIVRISVFANIFALLINIFFNWTLIFGNLGFPKLGIQGAAISTLISRIVEFIIVIIYGFFIDKRLCIKISDFNT